MVQTLAAAYRRAVKDGRVEYDPGCSTGASAGGRMTAGRRHFMQIPSRNPGRPQLALPARVIKTALQQAWNATTPLVAVPLAAIRRLAAEKYSRAVGL